MNEYDDILNRIVEEFYDTGKVVLNEQNEPEEVIDYFDIVDNDIDVTEFDIEDKTDDEYLTRNLTDDEKNKLEISDEELIDYLKDNEKEIRLVTEEQKKSTTTKICEILNGKEIEDYVNNFKNYINNSPHEFTNTQVHTKFQKNNKDFCEHSSFLKEKCGDSKTIKYIFDKCGKSRSQKDDDKRGTGVNATLNEESIDLELVQIISQKIEDAGNSVKRNPRKALRLWREALNMYLEAGEPEILSDRINRVVNMINYWSKIYQNTDTNDTNITNTDYEETSLEIDSEEDEETSLEIDSEEDEETSLEIDSEEDEETSLEIDSDNLISIFKSELSVDRHLKYGIWKITKFEEDLVTLERENIRKKDLEEFLFLCDNFVLELSKEEFIRNIKEKDLENFKNSFKKDKKIISGEDTLERVENVMLYTSPETTGEKSLKKEGHITKTKELMDKASLLSKYIIKEIAGKTGYKLKGEIRDTYDKLLNLMLKYTDHKNVTPDQKLEQLYHVVFDMVQLYDYVRTNKIGKVKDKLDKLFDSDNNYSKIREVFIEVRKQNNTDYEDSFQNKCNGEQYFTVESGGDKSTIFDASKLPDEFQENTGGWNKFLESELDKLNGGTYTILNIVDKLKNILLNGVNKYDIKTKREVTLTNFVNPDDTITLEEGRKIEVKYTKYQNRNGYKDFILSEFLSLYKNTDINTVEDNQLDNYNNVIEDMVTYLKDDDFGQGVIDSISDNTAGIFYENYIFVPLKSLNIYWSTKGQRKTEKRISLRVKPVDNPQIYYWKEGNPNCDERFHFDGCTPETVCPQNESTDRLDEIIENFFDTGKFVF